MLTESWVLHMDDEATGKFFHLVTVGSSLTLA